METKTKLKISGGVLIGLLGWHVYMVQRSKKRDHKAAVFFSELERHIAPGSVGLVESDGFNITYWNDLSKKIKKPYFMLKLAAADGFAKTIQDAWGYINDDEDKIYGVFRALRDLVQVSQVADRYYKKVKINLIDDLRSRLDKDEIREITKIVDKLPPYRLSESKPIKT